MNRFVLGVGGVIVLILALAAWEGSSALAQSPTPIPAGAPDAGWTPVIQAFDGVEMVQVPAGCFTMGSDYGSSAGAVLHQDEQPAHPVCFDAPFWIDRTEVTNAQFAASGGQAANASLWTADSQPREQITWAEASSFCEKRGARLPTEAEWEYAARGPEGRVYPWGNDFVPEHVVYSGNSGNLAAEVGSRPGGASWVGALDLGGNVSEWVADWYGPYAADQQSNPAGPASGTVRVIRGGSFYFDDTQVRAADRFEAAPTGWSSYIGFRCARSAGG